MHYIVNDKPKLETFYNYYKDVIWIGYNSRGYDQWVTKAILCDFNPKDMNDWIIYKDRKGFEFSRVLNKFPILNYDCSVGFRSLKELEAFQGHSIKESNIPFDIDRKLTRAELLETLDYCKHDVMETFSVFVEMHTEFESHMGLMKEYDLDIAYVNKTKAQMSAIILGATKKKHDDEFDIVLPDTLDLGKHQWIADWYIDWGKNVKDYDKMKLKTDINGVPHVFGIGGLHGAEKYYGTGLYLMADVGSYYPAIMIEYDFLSRNVLTPKKYKRIRDERVIMKYNKDPRQQPRKIVLNGTFGASKDRFNNLYDPLQANNTCIAGQLLLLDLIEKLEGKCQLIQSNTDGILVKLYSREDKDGILAICEEWSVRTRMTLDYDEYTTIIQRDVNNYILMDEDGGIKRKGSVVKELKPLDNDLPIVNRAVVGYFTMGIPVRTTVMASKSLMDFQKITKITGKYEYGFKEDNTLPSHDFYVSKEGKNGETLYSTRTYNGKLVHGKVQRCFASNLAKDGALYKKKMSKDSIDKTAGTPPKCFIDNGDVTEKDIPSKLDRQWYIDLAQKRIDDFI
jgi:DNA polymerase